MFIQTITEAMTYLSQMSKLTQSAIDMIVTLKGILVSAILKNPKPPSAA